MARFAHRKKSNSFTSFAPLWWRNSSFTWLAFVYSIIVVAFGTFIVAGMVSIQNKNRAFPGAGIAVPSVSNKQANSASLRSTLLRNPSSTTTGSTASVGGEFLRAASRPADLIDEDESPFSISLWLLPSPQDKANSHLSQMITSFSKYPDASVPFAPHVTLVGGTRCPSRKFLQETLLPRLRDGLRTSSTTVSTIRSGVPCHFEHEPVFKNQWNQACVLVMEESLAFSQLVQLCRNILAEAETDYVNRHQGGETTSSRDDSLLALPRDHYPAPLGKPHMSLYYGPTEGCPSREEIKRQLYHHQLLSDDIQNQKKRGVRVNDSNSLMTTTTSPAPQQHYSFQASRVAVWKTDPASTEGVAQWEELAVIDLPTV